MTQLKTLAFVLVLPFTMGTAFAAVPDQAGKTPSTDTMVSRNTPPTIDTNNDGKADAWDRDGNGTADAWDNNGDGKADSFDDDGDGKPDKATR